MTPAILYQNLFSQGTLTADHTANGYNVNNLCDYKTFTLWAGIAGVNTIEVDFSGTKQINSFAIVNHNLHTCEALITLQGYINNAWVDLDSEFTAASDNVIFRTIGQAEVSKLKLIIETSVVAPRVALLFAGVKIDFPYPPEAPYIPLSQSFEAKTERSKAGHFLGCDLRLKPFTISARFTELSVSFFTYYFDGFVSGYALKPFIWSYFGHYLVRLSPSWRYEKPQSLSERVESFQMDMEGTIR